MQRFVAYLPNGELFDAKYALLQFATIVSDERHQVAIETEAEMEDVDAALAKTGMPYILLNVVTSTGRNGDTDLMAVADAMSQSL